MLNTVYLNAFAAKFSSLAMSFLFTVLITRLLPIYDADKWFSLMSIFSILAVFIIWGQDQQCMRFASKNKTSKPTIQNFLIFSTKKIVKRFILISVALLISHSFGINIFGDMHNSLNSYLYVLLFSFLLSISLIFCEALRGLGLFQSVNIYSQILQYGFSSILILVILNIQPLNYLSIIFSWFIASIVCLILIIILLLKRVSSIQDSIKEVNFDFKEEGTNNLFFHNIFVTLTPHIFILILSVHGKVGDVSNFYIFFKLGSLITFGLQAINTFVGPKMSTALTNMNYQKALSYLVYSSIFGFLIGLPIFLVNIFGNSIYSMIFGIDLSYAIIAYYAINIANMMSAIAGSVMLFLIVSGNEKYLTICHIISILLSISLAIFIKLEILFIISITYSLYIIFVNLSSALIAYKELMSRIR